MLSRVSCVISFEWSTGKMKFEACPVEPPGLGSGPLSSSVTSVNPSRVRWWTRLLPTMPAPMTTTCCEAGSSFGDPAEELTAPNISDVDQARQRQQRQAGARAVLRRPLERRYRLFRGDLPVDHVQV